MPKYNINNVRESESRFSQDPNSARGIEERSKRFKQKAKKHKAYRKNKRRGWNDYNRW